MSLIQKNHMPADADRQRIQDVSEMRTEIYIPAKQNDSSTDDIVLLGAFPLTPNEWQTIRLEISDHCLIRERGFEIKPVINQTGLVSISNIRIINTENHVLWSAHHDFCQCSLHGDAEGIYHETGIQVVCYGQQAWIKVPAVSNLPDCPIILKVWIRYDQNFQGLARNCNFLSLSLTKSRKQNAVLQEHVRNLDLKISGMKADSDKFKADCALQLKQVRYDLHIQKTLTSRYFNELAAAENLLDDQTELSARNKALSKQNKSLSKQISVLNKQHKKLRKLNKEFYKYINRLHYNLGSLVKSSRWKTGDFLLRLVEFTLCRKKQPLAVDIMRKDLLYLKNKHKTHFHAGKDKKNKSIDPEKKIFDLISSLRKDYNSIKSSARWRLGYSISKFSPMRFSKSGHKTAVENLEQIFKQSDQMRKKDNNISFKLMQKEVNKLHKSFIELEKSKPWRTGSSFFLIIDKLLLRGNRPTSMDHALKKLSEYQNEH
ncbi:hypothetical protein [Desulfonatronovibrio magnus]|uniref:hypothetical protein n=1 Tax=Desulfonatronovibrio magnus TaxID=698827 RepID=UPI0005EAD135|nr:hypothetical protein [Desulfonatronovibrio magnus]